MCTIRDAEAVTGSDRPRSTSLATGSAQNASASPPAVLAGAVLAVADTPSRSRSDTGLCAAASSPGGRASGGVGSRSRARAAALFTEEEPEEEPEGGAL